MSNEYIIKELEVILFAAEEPSKLTEGVPTYQHMRQNLEGIRQIARDLLRELQKGDQQ